MVSVKKNRNIPLVTVHFLMLLLIAVIFLPGRKQTEDPVYFLCGIVIIEGIYLFQTNRHKNKCGAYSVILSILWSGMLIWEILVTKLNLMHPVLMPALENIFAVFAQDWKIMLVGVYSSLQVLFLGILAGLALGTLLGLVCGWNKKLREVSYPIANVLAPIPSIVFAPYIIAVMPTFRSASVVVILLGIFWPCFLKTIISVEGIDGNIIDLARTLELSNTAMVFKVLLPYSLPGILAGLRVTMTTAVMMLTFAEMMGATRGMGYYIVNFNTYGNYTKVIAGIIVVGMVVTLLSALTTRLQKCIKWKKY